MKNTHYPPLSPLIFTKNIHVNLHGENYIIVNKSECYGYIETIVFRLTYNRLEVAIKIDMYNLNLEFSFFICIFVILRFLTRTDVLNNFNNTYADEVTQDNCAQSARVLRISLPTRSLSENGERHKSK